MIGKIINTFAAVDEMCYAALMLIFGGDAPIGYDVITRRLIQKQQEKL